MATLADLKNSRARWLTVQVTAEAWRVFHERMARRTTGEAREKHVAKRAFYRKRRDTAKAKVTERDAQIRAKIDAQTVSKAGLQFIIREEGVVRHAYNDPVGHCTFGVGHLIHHGNCTAADREKWGTKENPKSLDFVMKVLDEDLDAYEKTVADSVTPPLRDYQFDACLSLCFNVGRAGFAGSTVVARLNAKNFNGAADAFLMWNKPPILIPRREREKRLFLTGRYS